MPEESVDRAFEDLLHYIQYSRGLDFRGYKRASLARRIALRMEAVGAVDHVAYQAHLEVDPAEFDRLLDTILINVTSFFRDRDAWDEIAANVVPGIVERAGAERMIRIWSVGCASGEEPFSIAMLFADVLGIGDFAKRVKVYATDLDEDALRAARTASYTARAMENVPAAQAAKYFDATGTGFTFNRELRKCVTFGRHNIVRDAPIGRIDLLLCRNLLIYLEADTQAVVLPRLHYALADDGCLFLGKAETQLARSPLFRPLAMKHRIFAKVPQDWRRHPGSFAAVTQRPSAIVADPRLLESMLHEAGSALIAVDPECIVLYANRVARDLLGVGEADVGRPFQDLPISFRPLDLRAPIEAVFRTREAVTFEDQEYWIAADEPVRLQIGLRPLQDEQGTAYAALLTIVDATRTWRLKRQLEVARESIESSVDQLQSANEELETTNEELQSTNEELETTNDELQSTNEELETLNEEARSSNQEMVSVNEELRLQAGRTADSRTYLEAVLRAMNGGIIVIDGTRRIRDWNRWSETRWGLRADDVVGTDFDALDIGLPLQLLHEPLRLIEAEKHEPVERVLEGVDRRGRRIVCRVRMTMLGDGTQPSPGVVLVFQDVTAEFGGAG